ncbi:MAG: septum formation initiator family protein [Cytophagales bacterium]|nr:septum formation initiator family protein [Cytophagales bacterium]MDW8384818.1 septum formation initiator family protein [Flammeovirgaceae bacterium]
MEQSPKVLQQIKSLFRFIAYRIEIKKMREAVKNSSWQFYLITGILFIIWMTFIDSNNLISQYQMTQKFKELQQQEEFYKREIQKLEIELQELTGNPEKMEKFAREKYFFKRRGEDIYYIKED